MAIVTIRSTDPVQMYWRMVFYGAADPDSELIINSKDEETGIFTVSLISRINQFQSVRPVKIVNKDSFQASEDCYG